MIVDTHVHVWALDETHQPAPDAKISPPSEADPVEWLIEDLESFQIDHCVLVQSSAFGWDNTYMVECLERYPGLFKAIGLVDPLGPTTEQCAQRKTHTALFSVRGHCGLRIALEIPTRRSVGRC